MLCAGSLSGLSHSLVAYGRWGKSPCSRSSLCPTLPCRHEGMGRLCLTACPCSSQDSRAWARVSAPMHTPSECQGGAHCWRMVQAVGPVPDCVSCRAASGSVAWVGGHGSGGGVGGGPPVCRDPLVSAVQVSRQETRSHCSASCHAVQWAGWGWRWGSPSCSHPSLAIEDAAVWSYQSSL